MTTLMQEETSILRERSFVIESSQTSPLLQAAAPRENGVVFVVVLACIKFRRGLLTSDDLYFKPYKTEQSSLHKEQCLPIRRRCRRNRKLLRHKNFYIRHSIGADDPRDVSWNIIDEYSIRQSKTGKLAIFPRGRASKCLPTNFATMMKHASDARLEELIKLRISASAESSHLSVDEKDVNLSNIKCERRASAFAGVLVSLSTGETFSRYPFYKIQLRGVKDVFGSTQYKWNEDYIWSKRVFAKSPVGLLWRLAIRAENSTLYTSGVSMVRRRPPASITFEEFLQYLYYGFRKNRPRLFTYVLVDDYFYCTETGIEFSKNMLSKHAMLSRAKEHVTMAGEFFFYWYNGQIYMFIDNNSGTYRPDGRGLELLTKVLNINFPSIHVIALDHSDEVLMHYKSRVLGGFIRKSW